MSEELTTPIPYVEAQQAPQLNDQQLMSLMSEADRLQTLYLDARGGVQSVFNFYMTFITAITGGVLFAFQLPADANPIRTTLTLIILLFFAALVGSVYIGAISARYANAERFAKALDSVRRSILQQTGTPVPSIYDDFMQPPTYTSTTAWYLWLVPTGTYQLFMSLVNSVSLAVIVWLILSLGEVRFIVEVLMFLITLGLVLSIFNIYSRIVIQRFSQMRPMAVDMSNDLTIWAARH